MISGHDQREFTKYTETTWNVAMAEKVTFQLPENFEDEKESSFLVSFSNGQLLPSAQNKPTFTLYQKTKDRSQKKRIIVAKTGHMSYIGSNFDPEAGAGGAKYCIGELDRSSGVVTLHKTEMVTLKPHIPGKTDTPEDIDAEVSTPVKSVDHTALVTSFGSEKQKRAYSSAKKNRVEGDALETALATAVTHAQNEMVKAEAGVSMQASDLIPVYNPLAEVPQDVYKLEDVLSLSALSSLKKASKLLKKATLKEVHNWRAENRFPQFVLEHVSSLPTEEPQRTLKAAILLGLCFLIKMHGMTVRGFQKAGLQLEGVDLPDNVKAELLEKFTEKQESKSGKVIRSLTARMRDKLRLHLLVLTLILDNFTVDCLSLQQDLKLSCTKIMDHFRALGCSVSKKAVKRKSPDEEPDAQVTHTSTAVLRIPLNFPKPRGQKRSKNQ